MTNETQTYHHPRTIYDFKGSLDQFESKANIEDMLVQFAGEQNYAIVFDRNLIVMGCHDTGKQVVLSKAPRYVAPNVEQASEKVWGLLQSL